VSRISVIETVAPERGLSASPPEAAIQPRHRCHIGMLCL
jgi:hypothetical protein